MTVTYDMTRLMSLPAPDGTRYFVTLGSTDQIDQADGHRSVRLRAPHLTPASVAAQGRLPEIDSDRLVFAGAWHGWGFHEDGARSGAAAAARLGSSGTAGRRVEAYSSRRRRSAIYESTIRTPAGRR